MFKLNIRLDGCGGRGGGGVGDKPFKRKRKSRALNLPETLFRREVTLCVRSMRMHISLKTLAFKRRSRSYKVVWFLCEVSGVDGESEW